MVDERMNEVRKICKKLNFKNWDKLVEEILEVNPSSDPVAVLYWLQVGVLYDKTKKLLLLGMTHRMTLKAIARVLRVSVDSLSDRIFESGVRTHISIAGDQEPILYILPYGISCCIDICYPDKHSLEKTIKRKEFLKILGIKKEDIETRYRQFRELTWSG